MGDNFLRSTVQCQISEFECTHFCTSCTVNVELDTDIARIMADERRAKFKFNKGMSSDELFDWLHNQGVGESDRKKIKGKL